MFVAVPLLNGALSVLMYNANGYKTMRDCLWTSALTGLLVCLGLLVLGSEGLIFIGMAIPLVVPSYVIGGVIGFALSKKLHRGAAKAGVMFLLCGMSPFLMALEGDPKEPVERSVTTRVVITGSPNDVWDEVIAFSPIPEPTDVWFRMGIAYPTDARIEGSGVGAVRYCNFSTGPFVEPITAWEEGRLLAFDVSEQPVPMTEISPYVGLHPPHLDWAVVSHRGQFELNDLGDGRTELVGTTWFHTVMGPEFYWGAICDHLVQKIHSRVLRHIKREVEADPISK